MLEILTPRPASSPPRAAVFDFDGTVSLIRAGWMQIMADLMVPPLLAAGTGETETDLRSLVDGYIAELTGLPTVHQMNRFREELQQRGVTPQPVEHYLDEYHDLLLAQANRRKDELRTGTRPPADHAVAGAHELLQALHERGVELTLASGTYVEDVREETELLGLTHCFEDRIFGPRGDDCGFTKRRIMQDVLDRHGVPPTALVAFGDGHVEITDATALGATAVAVASDELSRNGLPDPGKRDRLTAAGAHAVVPDYRNINEILAYLGFGKK